MRYIVVGYLTVLFLASDLSALTFGVVPQQSPFKLIKVWNPIVKYLQKATGEKIVLKIEHSIPEFEKVLYSGGYDIAYMNPYHYIVAHKKQGYEAKFRASKNIVGILVVNKKSTIKEVSMTDGKTFLFPSPNAFAATMLIKYELLKNYHINIESQKRFLYVNSHDSVYKGVARGIGDVGGGIERTFDNLNDKEAKKTLSILYKTKAYPSHPFAFKPSLSKKVQEKLSKAFLHMPRKLLDSLSIKHIVKTDNQDYDSIRDLVKTLKKD